MYLPMYLKLDSTYLGILHLFHSLTLLTIINTVKREFLIKRALYYLIINNLCTTYMRHAFFARNKNMNTA